MTKSMRPGTVVSLQLEPDGPVTAYVVEVIHADGVVGLRAENSEESILTTMPHLWQVMTVAMRSTNARPAPAVGLLQGAEKAELEHLADHIQEVIDGSPLAGHPLRPEYDPSCTTQAARIDAKVKELATTPLAMQAPSLKRKVQRYKQAGIRGLVDGRKHKPSNRIARADARLIEIIIELIGLFPIEGVGPDFAVVGASVRG